MRAAVLVAATLAFASQQALGADVAAVPEAVAPPVAVETRDIVLDLGVGVQLQPEFPSAQKYEFLPYPLFGLRFLRLPVFGDVVTGRERAFSIYPSIAFVGERDSGDASYLAGTDDVDFSFELGPGVALRYGWVRAFAEVRYGVTGHNGIVGEAGVDAIANFFGDRLEVALGPRVSLANDEYMDAYFGVPAGAFLPAYDPSGGFKDVGVALSATYAVTEAWRIVGRAEYSHFVGDAEDSPIVRAGNEDEIRVGVGITYRFGLDLF